MSRKRTTTHNDGNYHKLQNYEDEFVGTQVRDYLLVLFIFIFTQGRPQKNFPEGKRQEK